MATYDEVTKEQEIELYRKLLDYEIYKVGHAVLLTHNPPDLDDDNELTKLLKAGNFKRIVHRAMIKPMFRYVASTDLPAAAAYKALGSIETPDWKDWLLPPTDVMYSSIIGFDSSHYTQWKVVHAGGERGWIQSTDDDDEKYTPGDILHMVTTNMAVPGKYKGEFTVYNYSQSTLDFAMGKLLYGWKYAVKTIPEEKGVPSRFSSIAIRDVVGSS